VNQAIPAAAKAGSSARERVRRRSGFVQVGLAEASQRYTEGLKRCLGILLQAICTTPTETTASVYVPTDSTDAQYHLMGRGLKLSCPTSMLPASIVYHPLQWDLLAADFRFRFEIMRQAYDL
jgi:hypothetical protein